MINQTSIKKEDVIQKKVNDISEILHRNLNGLVLEQAELIKTSFNHIYLFNEEIAYQDGFKLHSKFNDGQSIFNYLFNIKAFGVEFKIIFGKFVQSLHEINRLFNSRELMSRLQNAIFECSTFLNTHERLKKVFPSICFDGTVGQFIIPESKIRLKISFLRGGDKRVGDYKPFEFNSDTKIITCYLRDEDVHINTQKLSSFVKNTSLTALFLESREMQDENMRDLLRMHYKENLEQMYYSVSASPLYIFSIDLKRELLFRFEEGFIFYKNAYDEVSLREGYLITSQKELNKVLKQRKK